MYKTITLILILFSITSISKAQSIQQNTAWLFLMNTTKFNTKWGSHFDLQVRSSDKLKNVRSLLIRPGITYYINSANNVTLGYLYTNTFSPITETITENRMWEQFIHTHKIKTVGLTHRFRLEQRLIERINADDLFAQRLRYFLRVLVPLKKDAKIFEKGFFGAVQNEVFLNIQNKGELNNSLFDQNRAYLALGYRAQKSVDLEVGYMNQTLKGLSTNTNNNILQVAIYTRF
jgi:hypothetical protein